MKGSSADCMQTKLHSDVLRTYQANVRQSEIVQLNISVFFSFFLSVCNEVKLNSWCNINCCAVTKHILQTKQIIEQQPTEKSKRRLTVIWHPIRFYADVDFNYFFPSAQMSIKLSPWGICTPWELCGTLVVKSPHTALFNEPLALRSMFLFL